MDILITVMSMYTSCTLCPRNCGIDRTGASRGSCGQGSIVRAACAVLHRGEEPPVAGSRGSGALFFTGCPLGCGFCQNIQISSEGYGADISIPQLAQIMLDLQREGAESINLVTASHFAPSVVSALELCGSALHLPVVWNSSGYETPETLELIKPVVNIHLPDLKTLSPSLASKLFKAADYPQTASKAILSMVESHPLRWSGERLVQGVIMRHLVLPGLFKESEAVLRWFAEHLAGKALLSLMVQFVDVKSPAALHKGISERAYYRLLELLDELGIEEGFIQEPGDELPWIPDFTRRNPFPEEYARPVWHCD
jgi:putative pyruvate formate lyase activating enzyme